jgi:hypothetical protein
VIRYSVLCQSAAGRELELVVHARSDSTACTYALRQADAEYPGAGWRAVYAVQL